MRSRPGNDEGGRPSLRRGAHIDPVAASIVVIAICGLSFGVNVATSARSLAQEVTGDEVVGPSNETCLNCHDRRSLEFVLPSGELVEAAVDRSAFEASSHGRAGTSCADCHTAIDGYPHPDTGVTSLRELTIDLNESCGVCHGQQAAWEALHGDIEASIDQPVCSDCHGAHSVAQPDPMQMPMACSTCHAAELTAYEDSVHASALRHGDMAAATCLSCHLTEGIHSASSTSAPSCTACHSEVDETYQGSAHGVASTGGEDAAATCRDCHGPAHDMRAATESDATTYPLNLPETCGMCHGDLLLTARLGLDNVYEQYVDSIHGTALEESGLVVAANCSTCHGSHGIRPHDDPASTVYPLHIPETCGTCHVGVLEEYRESVHGAMVGGGDLAAAICTDCHSAHAITESEAPDWQLDVIEECGTCHQESFDTFRDTFHGQASDLGFSRAARCSDCHGSHDILATDDPGSSVALDNRVETCRQCHPDANRNFVAFMPHADHGDRENYPMLFYAARLMNGLIIGVFAFFGFHTLLWFGRSSVEQASARRVRRGRSPLRLPRLLKRPQRPQPPPEPPTEGAATLEAVAETDEPVQPERDADPDDD